MVEPLLTPAILLGLFPPACTSGGNSADTPAASSEDVPIEFGEPDWTQESYDGYFHYFATSFVLADGDAWVVEDTEYQAAYAEVLRSGTPLPIGDVSSATVDICFDFGLVSERTDYYPRGDKNVGAAIPFEIDQRALSLMRQSGQKGYVSYWWEPEFPVADTDALTGSQIQLNGMALDLEIPEPLAGVSWQTAWTELETSGMTHLTWEPSTVEDSHSVISVSGAMYVDDARSDWLNVGCRLVDDGSAYVALGTFEYGGSLYIERLQQTAIAIDGLGLIWATARREQALSSYQ